MLFISVRQWHEQHSKTMKWMNFLWILIAGEAFLHLSGPEIWLSNWLYQYNCNGWPFGRMQLVRSSQRLLLQLCTCLPIRQAIHPSNPLQFYWYIWSLRRLLNPQYAAICIFYAWNKKHHPIKSNLQIGMWVITVHWKTWGAILKWV